MANINLFTHDPVDRYHKIVDVCDDGDVSLARRGAVVALVAGLIAFATRSDALESRSLSAPIYPVGLFSELTGARIPLSANTVKTSGFDAAGLGAAIYLRDPVVDRDYVAKHPRSAFIAVGGQGFRLQVAGAINPEMLGLRLGLGRGHAAGNQEAIAEALRLSRSVELPSGNIDFQTDDSFILPSLDGMEIAGQGWTTRIVTRNSAFLIPTLSRLTIRDLWVEQVITSNATIQSYHASLQDIRLIRLKITMRDQANCRNNCIALVMDNSPIDAKGVGGLRGLLVEDCWLAPGRMGIEVQNHRIGDDKHKLYGYRDVMVRGCTVWKAPAYAGMGISLSGWGTDCSISKNRFVACHGPNVEIIGSDRTTVSDNIFESAIGAPITASNFRIVSGCRILRNRTVGSAPRIVLVLQAVEGAEVAYNALSTTGVAIIKGRNVHIHDNVFTGEGTGALMQLDNARGVIVEKNTFLSKGSIPAPQAMIIAFNDTRDCIVRFNRMERSGYDVRRQEFWFVQAPPARGSVAYGNEHISGVQRFLEPKSISALR
jgi:hypothetical protein